MRKPSSSNDPVMSHDNRSIVSSESANGPLRLVLIDDDVDLRDALADALRAPLFETLTTGDANEFMRLVRAHDPPFAIVDLHMPEKDGIDILRGLAELRYSGEIVLMSGADPRIIAAAASLAASSGLSLRGCVHKPFSADRLIGLLDSRLDQSGGWPVSRSRTTPVPISSPASDWRTAMSSGR